MERHYLINKNSDALFKSFEKFIETLVFFDKKIIVIFDFSTLIGYKMTENRTISHSQTNSTLSQYQEHYQQSTKNDQK